MAQLKFLIAMSKKINKRASFEQLLAIWGILIIILGVYGLWWFREPRQVTSFNITSLPIDGDSNQTFGAAQLFNPKEFNPQQGGIDELIKGYNIEVSGSK